MGPADRARARARSNPLRPNSPAYSGRRAFDVARSTSDLPAHVVLVLAHGRAGEAPQRAVAGLGGAVDPVSVDSPVDRSQPDEQAVGRPLRETGPPRRTAAVVELAA